MKVRMALVALVLLFSCGVCHGKEDRWSNFAEDADLRYYLDQESVASLPDNVYTFWVKSVAKDKDYFRKEYQLGSLFQILTNYELDCAVSGYRVRGIIMQDRNRRELGKSMAEGETPFEPVPPESIIELVQNELCVGDEDAGKEPEAEEANGDGKGPGEQRVAQPAPRGESPAERPPVGQAVPVPPADAAASDDTQAPPAETP